MRKYTLLTIILLLAIVIFFLLFLLNYPIPRDTDIESIIRNPLNYSGILSRFEGTVLFSYPPFLITEDNGTVIFVENVNESFERGDRLEIVGEVVVVKMDIGDVDRWFRASSIKLIKKNYPLTEPMEVEARDVNVSYLSKMLRVKNLTLVKVEIFNTSDGLFYVFRFSELNMRAYARGIEVPRDIKFLVGVKYDLEGFLTYIVSTKELMFRITNITYSQAKI